MNNQEYEQKKCKCWKDFTDAVFNGNTSYSTCSALDFAFDYAYSLGKQETKQEIKQETDAEETVISGWVARDSDGNLFMYSIKPERHEVLQVWIGRHTDCSMCNNLFPDLTWDDDPIEVELIIKRKKNG